MIKEITAYKTSGGRIFEDKEEAQRHENEVQETLSRETRFYEKRLWIIDYVEKNYGEDDRDIERPINPYYESEWGWECYHKDNPIDKCVYSPALYLGEDCCVFCQEPEERK